MADVIAELGAEAAMDSQGNVAVDAAPARAPAENADAAAELTARLAALRGQAPAAAVAGAGDADDDEGGADGDGGDGGDEEADSGDGGDASEPDSPTHASKKRKTATGDSVVTSTTKTSKRGPKPKSDARKALTAAQASARYAEDKVNAKQKAFTEMQAETEHIIKELNATCGKPGFGELLVKTLLQLRDAEQRRVVALKMASLTNANYEVLRMRDELRAAEAEMQLRKQAVDKAQRQYDAEQKACMQKTSDLWAGLSSAPASQDEMGLDELE